MKVDSAPLRNPHRVKMQMVIFSLVRTLERLLLCDCCQKISMNGEFSLRSVYCAQRGREQWDSPGLPCLVYFCVPNYILVRTHNNCNITEAYVPVQWLKNINNVGSKAENRLRAISFSLRRRPKRTVNEGYGPSAWKSIEKQVIAKHNSFKLQGSLYNL